MITRKNTLVLTLTILLGLILSACQTAEPELDIDAQKTGFAQTADVQATMTAAAQPTATETLFPTPTLTATVAPTNTPGSTPTEVSNTEVSNTEEPPTGGTDTAQIIAQEPQDNTNIKPGEAFTVTWTFENQGTSTWTTNYYIEHAFGEQLGAEEKVYVWLPVPPKTSLPITVPLVAPETPGSKESNWKFFNANGEAFYDFSITINIAE